MNKYPKISIVTPSFNQGQFLEETILSVLDQNYPNLEYIIIDGGSRDHSLDVIHKYKKHLAYFVSEKDKGQSEAINKGIAKCTGEIFNWLNSDDKLEPGSLQAIAESFVNNNQPDLVYGDQLYFDETGILSAGSIHYRMKNELYKTIGGAGINQPAMFYNMNVIRKVKGIDESLHYCMDLDLFLKYMVTHASPKSYFIDKNLASFRLHPSSKTSSNQVSFHKERYQIYLGFIDQFDLKRCRKQLQSYYSNYFSVEEVPSRKMQNNLDELVVRKLINYHLIQRGLLHYFQQEYRLAKRAWLNVDLEYLDYDDRLIHIKNIVKAIFR